MIAQFLFSMFVSHPSWLYKPTCRPVCIRIVLIPQSYTPILVVIIVFAEKTKHAHVCRYWNGLVFGCAHETKSTSESATPPSHFIHSPSEGSAVGPEKHLGNICPFSTASVCPRNAGTARLPLKSPVGVAALTAQSVRGKGSIHQT